MNFTEKAIGFKKVTAGIILNLATVMAVIAASAAFIQQPVIGASADTEELEDGVYSLYAEMVKPDKTTYSMANSAINHNVQLEIKDGDYYLTVQFMGLSIYNQYGFLSELYYYDSGYTLNDYGFPQGNVSNAEVLEYYDVVDQYNDEQHLYPKVLKFPLVDKYLSEYAALRVFVPIMEAISDGTGTQSVFMKLHWDTLEREESDDFKTETLKEQSPELAYTDNATGVKVSAEKGVFPENTEVSIKNDTSANAGEVIYVIDFLYQSESVEPNGKFKVSIPLSAESGGCNLYRINDDASRTLVSGKASDGFYVFYTTSSGRYLLELKEIDSTEVSSDNTTLTTESKVSVSPETGDNTSVIAMIFIIVMVSSFAAVLSAEWGDKNANNK